MPSAPTWRPGSGPNAVSSAEAEAKAAKEAAEAAKHAFFKLLLEHKINAFSRWEASKKFESDPRCTPQLHYLCPCHSLYQYCWMCAVLLYGK
jgi:hypothetical protein